MHLHFLRLHLKCHRKNLLPLQAYLQKDHHNLNYSGRALFYTRLSLNQKNIEKSLAVSIYGEELCPKSYSMDKETGYCTTQEFAIGPFPAEMISRCMEFNETNVCESPIWEIGLMREIYEEVNNFDNLIVIQKNI